MTRALLRVDAGDIPAFTAALAAALNADGPAVLPSARNALDLPASGTVRDSDPELGSGAARDTNAELGTVSADGPDRESDPHAARVPQRVAVVVETSGSTGAPKRVALSADALLASAAAAQAALGGPGQWLLAVPATYIAGINVMVRSITAATHPVVLSSGPFTADGFAAAIRRMDGDLRFTSLVPAQLARVLDGGDAAVDAARSLDRVLLGGQAAPRELLARAAAAGIRVTRTYGSSETCGGCVYDGVPVGSAQMRIVDGEVELAGPMLAEGYLGDEERTATRFAVDDGQRWYRTGDLGTITDGVLSVTGRSDRVIISGGVKVSLDALERVVRAMPGLTSAVALPLPDARWGEVPILVNPTDAPLADIRAAVAQQLGNAARPARLVVGEIPVLANGKPDLMALASRLALGSGGVDAGER